MRLTKDEEKMLAGGYGEGYKKALEALVELGEFYGAECLVPVTMAYVTMGVDSPDGAFFKWLKQFADLGVTYKCPLTIAFAGGPERNKFEQQLGAQFSYAFGGSATNLYPPPIYGQYLISGGTNDTTLFNSIIGARCNSEGPIGQYMGAIVGKTPKYGYLLPENRVGKTLFNITATLKDPTDWNVLGYYISKTLNRRFWDVPVLTGLSPDKVMYEDLVSFCSTVASYGSCNHFLIEGISPEARTLKEAFGGQKPLETFNVGDKEIQGVYDTFSGSGQKPDCVSLFAGGGVSQLYRLARLVGGKKVSKEIPLFYPMDVPTRYIADTYGLTKILQDAGVQLGPVTYNGKPVDLWTKAKNSGLRSVVTDSTKNAHYVTQQEIEMVLLPFEKCVKTALAGRLEV
jgi:cis-L-3-hydroxyproline dehydratase